MGEKAYILSTNKIDQWEEVLNRCEAYDIYHLPGYHRLAEEQDDADASLFVFESGPTLIAMPLLIRRVEGLPGIESSEFLDATSVYGYPGPVSNVERPSDKLIRRFGKCLREYFENRNIIAAFSRLHPLLEQGRLLQGFEQGEILDIGPTVAIDLSLPTDVQRQKYRSNHKRDINKARREGIICIHDEKWNHLDAFIDIYHDTMRYHDADEYYFFRAEYFSSLWELLGDQVHLFVVIKDDVVLSGGLFTLCQGIIQYHLGGTSLDYRDMAPSKLMFDEVRLWGNEVGAQTFHLGGGVGGRKDSLYHFKAGFSDTNYTFQVWRAIVNAEAYRELVEQRRVWDKAHGIEAIDEEYFPAYRHWGRCHRRYSR